MLTTFVLLLAALSAGDTVSDARYPAVSPDGSDMVFCWRGSLWSVPVQGGTPRCLTPGRGEISHPVYSSDGTMLAFTSSVTGGGDVYVMPSQGGVSARLTYHGGEDRVLGWDGDNVLFASSREGGDNWVWKVPDTGGTPRIYLEIPTKNICLSDQGTVVERGYTPWWRRHYSGSASSSLWLSDGTICTRLDERPLDQRWPMTDSRGDIFYVMEDHGGFDRFYNTEGSQLSEAVPGSITFPSVSEDGSVVVFESDGELYRCDTETFQFQPVYLQANVDLPFPLEELFFAGVYTTDFAVDFNGKVIVMESEGEIYAASIEEGSVGEAVRVTDTPALESRPRLSADGTMLLCQQEQNGEVTILMGSISLTEDKPVEVDLWEVRTGLDVSLSPEWSPSGDFSFLDNQGRLHVMDVLGGRSRMICDETGILHHSWSPDSRWIAFSKAVEAHREDVYIVSSQGGEATNVSRHPNDDFQPVWPSDGRRILWASRTDQGDYSIVQAWFDPEDWEADTEHRDDLLDQPVGVIKADADNLYMRTEELCQVEGYYDFFGATPDGRTIYFPATDPSGQKDLWSVGWDGEDLVRESFGDHSPTRIQPTDTEAAGAVYYLSYGSSLRNTAGDLLAWTAPCSRHADLMQREKFCSAWRMLRDSFYDSDMHGVDWDAMREKYQERAAEALLNSEFNDVVRRMLGELSASHLGIYGPWEYSRIAYTGETGIFAESDWNGEGIRIDSVLPMSPAFLAGFKPGDTVISVEGVQVDRYHNYYAPFRNAADREIQLEFIRDGNTSSVRITPVSQWDMWNLIYDEWLAQNRRTVADLSENRVGYLHIPSMNLRSVSDFRRDLYAEGLGREAMIIDVRGNLGGSTHDQIISSLSRETYAFSMDRTGIASVEPLGVYRQPLVLLINETCYSDAEIFPAAWKELDLGPIVGNTTYGAVIGTVDVELADGTGFRLPGTGWYTLAGENLENNGVAPDITVIEQPCDAAKGIDRQLEAAVQAALEQI